MIYFNLLLFFALLYSISFSSAINILESSEKRNNYTNKICTHLNYNTLFSYLNIDKLDNSVKSLIKTNPSPLNNQAKLNLVVRNPNPCPFREKVLQKMMRNETINIVIIGGADTESKEIPIESRWTTLLSKHLNSDWYTNKIQVIDLSSSSCNIGNMKFSIDKLKEANPDLIISDFVQSEPNSDINQIINYYKEYILALNQFTIIPSLFFNLSFKLIKKSEIPPPSNSIHLKSDQYYSTYNIWKRHDYSKSLLDFYNIPYTSYRNLVYPDVYNPSDNLYNLWYNTKSYHEYYSSYMFNSISYLLKDSLISNRCHITIKEHENPFNYCNQLGYIKN